MQVKNVSQCKTIKLFVKTLSRTLGLNHGPLVLQHDTLPTELSGLSGSLCKTPGNSFFHNGKYRPTCWHCLPFEKVPTLKESYCSLGNDSPWWKLFPWEENADRVGNIYSPVVQSPTSAVNSFSQKWMSALSLMLGTSFIFTLNILLKEAIIVINLPNVMEFYLYQRGLK